MADRTRPPLETVVVPRSQAPHPLVYASFLSRASDEVVSCWERFATSSLLATENRWQGFELWSIEFAVRVMVDYADFEIDRNTEVLMGGFFGVAQFLLVTRDADRSTAAVHIADIAVDRAEWVCVGDTVAEFFGRWSSNPEHEWWNDG